MPSQRTVFGYVLLALLLLTGCPNTSSVSDDDARLRNLIVLGGGLQPPFSPAQTDYVVEMGKDEESFTLTPQSQHFGATIRVNGEIVKDSFPSEKIPFNGSQITTTLTVTSADGLEETRYVLTIVAQGQVPTAPVTPPTDGDPADDTPTVGDSNDSTDATLETLVLDSGTLIPVFQSEQLEYSVDISALKSSVKVTPGQANPNAHIQVNGVNLTADQPSSVIALTGNTTVITVVVTAADGSTQKTYTINAQHLAGGAFAQTAYLKATRPSAGAGFGGGVAVSGDTLAIGAPEESFRGLSQAGAVYLFKRTGGKWQFSLRLQAPDPVSKQLFGQSLALKGDTLAIGSSGDSSELTLSGSVFVYHRENGRWQIQNRNIDQIKATPVALGHRFGYNVVLSDERHLAVASLRSIAFPGSGGVYVFAYDGNQWKQDAHIWADHFGASDRYGHSIDLEGNRLAIGSFAPDAECTSPTNTDAGSVHIYERDNGNWKLAEVLHAFQPDRGDRFGFSVDLDGDRILVGAPCEDGQNNSQTQQGAAYEFTQNRGQWTERFKFVAPDASAHSLFGDTVALAGSTAMIGASFQGHPPTSAAGKIYLFNSQGSGQWTFNNTLQPGNPGDGDRFGLNLSYADGVLLMGAPGEDSRSTAVPLDNSVNNAGAAYVFEP